MRKIAEYKGILPYASELFGVYQPLLGWKSRIIKSRYSNFQTKLYKQAAEPILASPHSLYYTVGSTDVRRFIPKGQAGELPSLRPVDYLKTKEASIDSSVDSMVARVLKHKFNDGPPEDWSHEINTESMTSLLNELKGVFTREGDFAGLPELEDYIQNFRDENAQEGQPAFMINTIFDRETKIAGYLVFLSQRSPQTITDLFFRTPKSATLNDLSVIDPLESFGANSFNAVLSPIGIIHIYREYFFEFDSFLGPSVGHLWISPGGTVELIEVNTRKTFTEFTTESAYETTSKSENEKSTKDELSDAVKDENKSEIKFGFTNTASYTTPVFQDTAVASLSLDNAKMNARETTHKQMREQSEKLSSEIKRNFKTTFRTSTEVTDTTSKRYVIQNTTKELVNYELRRKMRKVGVEVQDIGVQLCWHTFVDDPAKELGIAKLVHIAAPADLHNLKEPDALPMPEKELRSQSFPVNIQWPADDNRYYDFLPLHPPFQLVPPKPGYIYSRTDILVQPGGEPWGIVVFPLNADVNQILMNRGNPIHPDVELIPTGDGAATERSVRSISVGIDCGSTGLKSDSEYEWNLELTVVWKPSRKLIKDIEAENKNRNERFTAEKQRLYQESLYKAAAERIKLASLITPRSESVLREEERTVIYRQLIGQLMTVGPNDSKHVVSELIRSIFDVDKMLYFVAPEWWVPRLQHLHGSQQHLVEQAVPGIGRLKPQIPVEDITDWGGSKENKRDSYYITSDSAPAKLGSSLGWLIQLDGDNMRNALLNSPWVKAVMPIRIGKEQAAINWLRQAHVEGSDGLNAIYISSPGDPPELQSTPGHTVTVEDALKHLINEIHEFDANSRTAVIANPAQPDDVSNHFAGSLPTEAVFEHGFYPLQGGVRFNQSGTEQVLVSQWTEILPTDQVAALAVKYDPKTLQIVTPSDIQQEDPE